MAEEESKKVKVAEVSTEPPPAAEAPKDVAEEKEVDKTPPLTKEKPDESKALVAVESSMAETKPVFKRWEDLETDVLVKIFKELSIVELAPISQVCRSWRVACSDSWIWNTLDLGLWRSNFIETRASPCVWVDERSDRKLTELLRIAKGLSCGNINCLIFHYNLYMKDYHLTYISESFPHLKRLVLPAWNHITKTRIRPAIRRWKELESLTMPSIPHPAYLMEEIGRNCKNFSSLKIMGIFDEQFASTIVSRLPTLKILSLRCSILTVPALLFILDGADHLEVLNISHCLFNENLLKGNVIMELDDIILEKASRLREFYHCMSLSCSTCQRMARDGGLMRWHRYEEWFWRQDEVCSLALGEDYGKLFDKLALSQFDAFRN